MMDTGWSDVLDILCPMHLVLDSGGNLRHAGPVFEKLWPDMALRGQGFFQLLEVKRPRRVSTIAELRASVGVKLQLVRRNAPHTEFKGIMLPLPQHKDGFIVNLSFGIAIADAVRDHGLTNNDFAATDLALEMLYLMEAKSVAMDASRQLNHRLQGARNEAQEQALTDPLTGLSNRRAMELVLLRLIDRRSPFAVMHIDLDHFKAVNDTLGHAAGDHVLQKVAQIMLGETRRSDTVARVGGDEFTVILPYVESHEVLNRIGHRIIEQVQVPIPFAGQLCQISASIGAVWIEKTDVSSAQAILADADLALYASKRSGRSKLTHYASTLRGDPSASSAPLPGNARRPN